jgi:O-antigen/teichoic acid export membrane protein
MGFGRKVVHGSSWMVAMRFAIRGIGLVSTIILARLLTPADFGIVAMAMLLIGFIEVFNETGQQAALIAHRNPERAHYDSAWTISVMIGCALTVIILAVAPLASDYFNDPRIVPIVQVLSLRVLLGSFINIGTIDFRRQLDFAREFRFGLGRKFVTFVTTLTLALIWRNYWALVIGTVVGHAMEVALSYIMHSYRPRFCLQKVREIWSYSIWVLIQSIGRYFEGRIDDVVVAGVASPAQMGRYTVAAEFGALPITEVIDPVSRALFPSYATIALNLQQLRQVYLRVFAAAATICASAGVGLMLVAEDFVAVLLGSQWMECAPLLVWFAAAASITGVCNTVFPVFNAVGQTRQSATQTWLRVCFYIPGMIWAASTGVLMNFAIARFSVAVILAPTFFFRLRRIIKIEFTELLGALWRPILAAGAMAGVVLSIDFTAHVPYAILRLAAEVIIGASVFASTQLGLWALAGSPVESIERAVIDLIVSRTRSAKPQGIETAV